MKEKLKWSKQQKRNKIFFIPEVLSGTDEKGCEQDEHWEMLFNKLRLWLEEKLDFGDAGAPSCLLTRSLSQEASGAGEQLFKESFSLGKAGFDRVSPNSAWSFLLCHLAGAVTIPGLPAMP